MSIIVRFFHWLLQIMGLRRQPDRNLPPPIAPAPPKPHALHTQGSTAPPQAPATPPVPPVEPEPMPLPYRTTFSILERSELVFYRALQRAVGSQAIICPKVRLGDLFYVKRPERDETPAYFYKISSKHVDFLLCSPRNLRPLVGIELDDKSHLQDKRQVRDTFVNAVFATANLPLLRIPTQTIYAPEDLRAQLAPYLSPQQATPPPVSQPAPTCPKCGKPMTRRVAQQGRYVGQLFWGCTGYPDCKTTLPYSEE